MPRFYFDAVDGRQFHDQEGTELATLDAALDEAYRILCQLIPLHQHRLKTGEAFTLTVGDENRLTLLTVEIVSTRAPAIGEAR